MKIILLHGDNTLESYKRLQSFIKEARRRNWDVIRVNEKKQNIEEILVSDSLFAKEKLVSIENINLLNKKEIKWIEKRGENEKWTIIIYHTSEVSKTFIKSFAKIDKIEEFKLPKLIWSFLDSVYPGNAKNAILLLHEVIKKEPIEFVFALLARQFRDIFWVKVEQNSTPFPPWRIGKIKRQASRFSEEKLKNIISEMAEIDIKAKTSRGKLQDLLDFLLITQLE